MTDATFDPVAIDGIYTVVAPSGAKFSVMTPEEVAYFEERSSRYMTDNHFVNISDLQDVDRMLIMETMCWRCGLWLSQERDYFGESINPEVLQKALENYSKELRLLKKALGIDKAGRDRQKGESFDEFLETLKIRAKEFGVNREKQLTKTLVLFNELSALVTFHDNCTPEERRENSIEESDVLEWVRKVAIPEYQEIDKYFKEHQQRFWIREL